ncbi:MAG: hypothetical protein ACK5P6_01050 [Pseudobdellovibrionaceae bacterium]
MKKICFLSFVVFFFSTQITKAQTAGSSAGSGGATSYAKINLSTNNVEKGLTQTQGDPAFQTELGNKFGEQGLLALKASNVAYENFDSHLLVRGIGSYKFLFSANADLRVKLEYNKYFKAAGRDGYNFGIDLGLFGYRFLLETENNFEGSKTERTWFAFQREFSLPWSLWLDFTAGYSQLKADGLNAYFDTRSALTYKGLPMNLALVNTFNSQSSQFGKQGDIAFFLEASIAF